MIFLSDYSSYFDAGADDRDVVVAGYVSSVDEWAHFETEWRLTLLKYQVPYFHMKEFTCSRGPFAGQEWKHELRRAAFLSSLIGITNTWTIFSMAFAVSREAVSYTHLLLACNVILMFQRNRSWHCLNAVCVCKVASIAALLSRIPGAFAQNRFLRREIIYHSSKSCHYIDREQKCSNSTPHCPPW